MATILRPFLLRGYQSKPTGVKAGFVFPSTDARAGFVATASSSAAEQPQAPYNEAQLEHVYDNLETRPDTTPRQRRVGIGALRSLLAQDGDAGGSVLGSALSAGFIERDGASSTV